MFWIMFDQSRYGDGLDGSHSIPFLPAPLSLALWLNSTLDLGHFFPQILNPIHSG
jgi:hypothetical protein